MMFQLRKDCLGWSKCGMGGGGDAPLGGTALHRIHCPGEGRV